MPENMHTILRCSSRVSIIDLSTKRLAALCLTRATVLPSSRYGTSRRPLTSPDSQTAGEITRRALARATDAPEGVLAQALAPLVRAGLLNASGVDPGGGYRLAQPSAQVSIHDIVIAIDGHEHEERCVLSEDACDATGICPFHPFLIAAQERFLDTLLGQRASPMSSNAAYPRPLPIRRQPAHETTPRTHRPGGAACHPLVRTCRCRSLIPSNRATITPGRWSASSR